MSIFDLALVADATSGSITGGTAMTLEEDGVVVPNGVHLADMGVEDFLVRPHITLRTRVPQKQSDGTYSKAKRYGTIVVPRMLDSGLIVYDLVRIEKEFYPSLTAAGHTNLDLLGAQFFIDANLANFRKFGSLK